MSYPKNDNFFTPVPLSTQFKTKKSTTRVHFCFNGASIEAFFEPFREMNIEELYATALQIQDFYDRHPHMKRDL